MEIRHAGQEAGSGIAATESNRLVSVQTKRPVPHPSDSAGETGHERSNVSDSIDAINLILRTPRYTQPQGACAAVVLLLPLLMASPGIKRPHLVAAQIFSVSERYVFYVKKIRDNHPAIFAEILRGETTLQAAKRRIGQGRRRARKGSK